MNFLHLPPGFEWEPEKVAELLAARGVEAVVDQGRMIVALPDASAPSWLKEFAAHLLPKAPHQIVIEYSKKRFVKNIVVSSPSMLDGVSEPLGSVEASLLETGCKLLEYRDAIQLYCPDSSELPAIVDQYELLAAEKEECVAQQYFEAALEKRDRQNELVEQIDAYFFQAVGRV